MIHTDFTSHLPLKLNISTRELLEVLKKTFQMIREEKTLFFFVANAENPLKVIHVLEKLNQA